jgi:hypothetical protein
MLKSLFVLPFAFLFALNTNAQDFSTDRMLPDTAAKGLYFSLEQSAFIKNNEYFNEFAAGYTGIGLFAQPSFQYFFNSETKIQGGVYLLKYSGVESFNQVLPILSVQHKLGDNLDLVMGSIYGTLEHKLEEPLFRVDRYFQDHVEYGLQLLYNDKNRFNYDFWVNWEQYILPGDPFQEEIQAGWTSNYQLKKEGLKISIPTQFLIHHMGGQVDSSPDPVASIINGAVGLEFDYPLSDSKSLIFEPWFFFYQGWGVPETGVNSQAFNSGNSVYLKLRYETPKLNAMLGYWNANQFIAPLGEYLFMSISEKDLSFSEADRQLITSKISLRKTISKHMFLELRSDFYYDLNYSQLSYSNSLYFVINESFFLKGSK